MPHRAIAYARDRYEFAARVQIVDSAIKIAIGIPLGKS
jgi:hypothetical protein